MSKWTVTIEIVDNYLFRCEGCPMILDNSNCGLQEEKFETYQEQLENCPLKEVVE